MHSGSRSRRHFLGGVALGATATASPAAAIAGLQRAAAARGDGGPQAGPGGASGVFDVTRFGARPDGKTPATDAIQRAIEACGKAGGGIVLLPPGRYLSGALFLRSNVHFHLSTGATLTASTRFDDFPPIMSRSEGIERLTYASLLTGDGLENVIVSGGGVIEGNGPPWWTAYAATRDLRTAKKLPREAENPPGSPLKWPRPRVINFIRCEGVLLSGITVRDSPYWTVHFVYCQDVLVDGVLLTSLQANNIDGLIVDSCKQVRITNSSVSTGSDPIAVKAGYNEDGRRVGIPCEDVVVTNCNLVCTTGAGISIGSETAGGIKNVTVSNCTITGSRYGLHVRSPRGRGGGVQRVRFDNMVLDRIQDIGIFVTHYYDSVRMLSFEASPAPTGNPETDRTTKRPVDEGTPTFRDIDFSGITMGEVGALGLIEGLPERFIRGVRIRDVSAPGAKTGLVCLRATEVTVSDLTVGKGDSPAVSARDVDQLHLSGIVATDGEARTPLLQLENVDGAFINGCNAGPSDRELVRLNGARNRHVQLGANSPPRSRSRPG